MDCFVCLPVCLFVCLSVCKTKMKSHWLETQTGKKEDCTPALLGKSCSTEEVESCKTNNPDFNHHPQQEIPPHEWFSRYIFCVRNLPYMGSAQLSWTSKFNRRTIMNTSVSLKPERKIYSGQNIDNWTRKNIKGHHKSSQESLWCLMMSYNWSAEGGNILRFHSFQNHSVTTIALNRIIYASESMQLILLAQCTWKEKKKTMLSKLHKKCDEPDNQVSKFHE